MPETEKGTFLFDLFEEKIRSFLFYLEKAKKTYHIQDIHQLRVNTKRINAIYQLIESATALNFDAESHLKPMREIFKSAGKLREGQVNLELIKAYDLHPDAFMLYSVNLEKSQVKTIRDLKKGVESFDKISFDHTIGMIKAYCEQIGKTELLDKMDQYIRMKAISIEQLLQKKQHPNNVHRIRMNLKAMEPVLSLLCSVSPEKFGSEAFESLKETALYIGEWHDRMILIKSINGFLKNLNEKNKYIKQAMLQLIDQIQNDIEELNEKIDAKLTETLAHIIQ